MEDVAAYAEMPRKIVEIRQTLDVLQKSSVTVEQQETRHGSRDAGLVASRVWHIV